MSESTLYREEARGPGLPSHTQSFVCSQLSGLVSRCEVCHREKSTKYSFNLKEVKGMTSPSEKSAGAFPEPKVQVDNVP